MKKIYLSILASMFVAISFATVHTVTNSGQTFSPAALTISVGDTVVWTIGASHNVVEVDMATYTANGNTALAGGFSTPFGGDTVIFDLSSAGMYYYVCDPHAAAGMKGTINVTPLAASTGNLIITMISDGDCSGGNPKVLELYADGYVNFSEFSVENQTNANTTWGNTQNLGSFGSATNEFIYIYTESSAGAGSFATEYPSAVNNLVSGVMNINGDDRIRLIDAVSSAVIDQFGVSDIDGSGETWEYKDGFALRNPSTGPDGAFVEANWTISNGALDGNGLCQGGTTSFETMTGVGTFVSTIAPSVSFKTDSLEFTEGVIGLVNLDSLLINPAIVSSTETFDIVLDASSTADASDFNLIFNAAALTLPHTHDFATETAFTAQALQASITDDATIEGTEWAKLVLRNGTNGLNIGLDSVLYIRIADNDFPQDTFVALNNNAASVNEGAMFFDISLDYQQTATNAAHTVELMLVSGDAADVDNFATMMATFNSLTEKFTVNLTDDALVEGNEVLTFALVNPTNGLFIGSDSIFTLTIVDNDIPTFALGLVDGNDAIGADSVGLQGKFVGVVNSLDRGFNANEFSIQDATGSVDVFSNVAPFSTMTVAIGDEVEIEGTILFSNGIVRIGDLVSMNVISTGNVVTPVVVTEINDENESDLVRMNGLTLVDPSQWMIPTIQTAGFDVRALDSNGDTVIIRIDRDYASLYNSAAPTSAVIDVIGVASQFDFTAPFDANYQIIPRDLDDIILYPTLNFSAQGSIVNEDAGTVTIDFTVANDIGAAYTVDVALTNGDALDIDNFTTQTAIPISGGAGSFTVKVTDDTETEGNEGFEFTVSNPSAGLLIGNANTYELTIAENDGSAIEDINVIGLKLYPNPAAHTLNLDFISNESQISTIQIVDVLGRVVTTKTVLLNNGENSISFDVASLAKGNYVLEIATENGSHTENVMVK